MGISIPWMTCYSKTVKGMKITFKKYTKKKEQKTNKYTTQLLASSKKKKKPNIPLKYKEFEAWGKVGVVLPHHPNNDEGLTIV